MNFRQIIAVSYTVLLLLQGRPGDEIVAELSDWSGPTRSSLCKVAASLIFPTAVLMAVFGLGAF